jgi:hypothetical protein
VQLAAQMTEFEIAAALRLHSNHLEYASRLVFTVGNKRRTYGSEVAIQTLEQLGRPANSMELVNAVRTALGATAFQLKPSARVARLTIGTWGLRGRDFHLTDAALSELLDSLETHLRQVGEMHHFSLASTEAFLSAQSRCSQLTTLTIADLAQASRRFRLGPEGRLRLAERR